MSSYSSPLSSTEDNSAEVQILAYSPSDEDRKQVLRVFEKVEKMIKYRNLTYREFNDRTLITYINDSDQRLNSYLQPKEAYDPPKEEWQSNIALTTIRDKQKRILAGFSLQVPDMETKAFGEDMMLDIDRAEIAKWLIVGSYLQENSVVENFWQSWECCSRGTVIQYEGYLKTRYKQKYIKEYDIVSGQITCEEREVDVDDKCISYTVPLSELFIGNMYVHDVQNQPFLAWIRYLDQDQFEIEFGKYDNAKFVKNKSQLTDADVETFYYQSQWKQRVDTERPYEIIKFYCKYFDEYVIIANGVLLLNAPLLWKINGKKVYPFAKTIWEPFADKNFFYGKSFPDIMSGQYDAYNTLWNTMQDKQYRSLVPALLVGRVNQDAFDLEDEIITGTTKISVEDVSQVQPLQLPGVNNGDVLMLRMISQSIEEQAPSMPSLIANKQSTAREIMIADQKLTEMKVLYNEMLTDLWRQKYYLRLANIQMNYPQPRKVLDEKGKEKTVYRTYVVDNATLNQMTGETGLLAIQFKNIKVTDTKEMSIQIAAEEEALKKLGVNFKKMIIPTNYFDNYRIQIEIISSSVYKTNMAKVQASTLEKLQTMSTLFPQIFVVNQTEFFSELCEAYEDNPNKYLEKYNAFQNQKKQAAESQIAAATATPGARQLPPGTQPVPVEGQSQGAPNPAAVA